MKKRLNKLEEFFIAVILPGLIFFIVHFWFVGRYTLWVFNQQGFLQQYESGIFKYRVLGRQIVLWAYQITQYIEPTSFNFDLLWDDGFEFNFYVAYGVVNLLFFILYCITLYKILSYYLDRDRTIQVYISLLLLTTISLFVVTPYDCLSYFLLGLSIYIFLRVKKLWRSAILLLLLSILGTLTRETHFLFIPYGIVVSLHSYNKKENFFKTLWVAIAFILTYFGLRFYYGFGETSILQSITVAQLQSALAQIGLFSTISTIIAINICLPIEGKYPYRSIGFLYLLSSPYIIVSLLSGVYIELRLAIPLVITNSFAVIALDRSPIPNAPMPKASIFNKLTNIDFRRKQ